MIRWLVKKYDWWLYGQFFKRWVRNPKDGGWTYLMFLWLQRWLKENPLDESVKHATEVFFENCQRRQ